ncbi:MAG: hypothetical protein IH940_03465 [Acidobacteria bacterium]|nr:hypothetical protein [Acidobacteriota bacterium]
MSVSDLTLVAVGIAVGAGGVLVAGATAAAIPLWFLSNYTIDTAVTPALLPRFRARPLAVSCMLGGSFLLIEATRYLGVPKLPYLNWVIGWLIFQVVGFAWRDGLFPTGRSMVATAVGLWCALVAMVTVGPWPVAMVHHPGLQNSPTNPPSIALLTFGLAYGATAIAAAPALNRWLQSNKRAWTVVVGASGVAMSVYLWHMTAALVSVLLLDAVGMIPATTTGSDAWWIAKVPFALLATLVLIGIVALVAPIEGQGH